MSQPLSFFVPLAFPAGCKWQIVHLDLPHLPVNLEWFQGIGDAFVNNPAVGGEFNLLTDLQSQNPNVSLVDSKLIKCLHFNYFSICIHSSS